MESNTFWLFMTFLIPAIVGIILLFLDSKFTRGKVN